MSAESLQSELAALAIDGQVEAHGPVAVLVTAWPEQLRDPGRRAAAVQAAATHGFRTLAIELAGGPSDAGRLAPIAERADFHRA
jgi:hypothetical protein